jgi:uncharacterized membrane protein
VKGLIRVKLRTVILALAVAIVLVGSSFALAASEIVFIGKGDQAHLLEQYFKADPEINLTIVYSENLFDTDSPYFTPEAMANYDAIILGEVVIGDSFNGSIVMEQWLQEAIRDRVAAGAGFAHIGGWCSYQGGNAGWSGQWHGTPIDEILPVNISADWDTNDNGCDVPAANAPEHPIVAGLSWDAVTRFGGYNKVEAAEGSEVVLSDPATGMPLITVGTYGEGKTVAYAGGLGGGWDADFIQWADFPQLWLQLARYLVN